MLAVSSLVLTGCQSLGLGEGPMRPAPEHGSIVEGPVGRRLTDGFEILQLGGDRPATILSVESVGGDGSLKYLGAYLAGPDRKLAAYTQPEGFPPTTRGLGEIIPAEGAVIEPREQTRRRLGYELLLGYEIVDDSEIAFREEIVVTYRIDDTDYAWRAPAKLVYCPESATSEECFTKAGLR